MPNRRRPVISEPVPFSGPFPLSLPPFPPSGPLSRSRSQPNGTTSHPNETPSHPNETTSQPNGTPSRPNDTPSHPNETSSHPNETPSHPNETPSQSPQPVTLRRSPATATRKRPRSAIVANSPGGSLLPVVLRPPSSGTPSGGATPSTSTPRPRAKSMSLVQLGTWSPPRILERVLLLFPRRPSAMAERVLNFMGRAKKQSLLGWERLGGGGGGRGEEREKSTPPEGAAAAGMRGRRGSQESSMSHGASCPRHVLGVPIEVSASLDPSFDGVPLPACLRLAIDHIEDHGLHMEGIYRISAPLTSLNDLERAANAGTPRLQFKDAHEAAGLIKRFLRQLPPPFLPPSLDAAASACRCDYERQEGAAPCSCGAAEATRKAAEKLPPAKKYLLAYTFQHAQNVIAMKSQNKMSLQALGVLLQANLEMTKSAVTFFLMNSSPRLLGESKGACYIFNDIPYSRLRQPRSPEEVEAWKCDDRRLIDEEIEMQQRLIQHLHQQIQQSRDAYEPLDAFEERLWAAQTAETALRRKRTKTVGGETGGGGGKVAENGAGRQSPEAVAAAAAADEEREGLVEEKQLLAVHVMLREDVEAEMNRVAQLLWRLEGGRAEETSMMEVMNKKKKEEDEERAFDDEEEEGGEWKERTRLEQAAREVLIEQIVSLRSECAHLRAQIEIGQASSTITIERY